MASYVSLFNETTGDFDTINIGSANINSANINTATVINATITNENVTNSIIGFLSILDKLLLPDGTNLNPSLAFSSDTELGFYRSALGEITFVYNGLPIFRLNTSQTTLFNNLFAPNRVILDEFTGTAATPTLQFFDIGLGIFRSNLGVLSISSQGFQIVDIDDLKLKVNGAIEANSATIGTLSIGTLNVNNLSVTGTSSFGNTITCSTINSSSAITATGGFISRLGTALISSYGFSGLPTTYIYATAFPSIDIQVGGSGCMEFIPTQISVFKNLSCGTNSITCGPISSGQITSSSSITANGGFIARLGNSVTSSYGFNSLGNSFIYATANPSIVIQVGGVANIDTGNGYVTIYQPVNVLNQSITCASLNGTGASTINTLTCTSSFLNTMVCTSGSITNVTCTTANITNLTSTTSNVTNLTCTSGTISNITSTTITNSGTMSSGNTTINGTLQVTGKCRMAVTSPNLNSTNDMDVYGVLGMSLANANTFYGINAYFSGGWRPIRNGFSAAYGLSGSGGINITQSATSNTADALITMNNMMSIATNADVQFYGNVDCPSLTLSAQPLLVREMTAIQTIPNNTNTTITTWNNVVTSIGTGINYAAGIFTIVNAGTYLVSYQVSFVANGTGGRESWIVHTSRNYGGVCSNPPAARRMLLANSAVIRCAASDIIALNVYQNSGANLNVDPSTDSCTFTIEKLN